MSKATKREMMEREADIQTAIESGLKPSEFAETLARKHKCSAHSISRQYRDIINAMIEIQQDDRAELKVKLMLRNEHLYREALKKDNIRGAMDSINLQAKLGGLYDPTKVKEEEKKQPIFNFVESGEATLAVVPKDDDDSAVNE